MAVIRVRAHAVTALKPRRRLAAWLGIVAMLLNALLPSAATAAAGPARGALAFATCAALPPGAPDKGPARTPVHHCPLCLAAAAALPPPRNAGFTAPLAAAVFVYAAIRSYLSQIPPRRHVAARPRAPPAPV